MYHFTRPVYVEVESHYYEWSEDYSLTLDFEIGFV